MATVTVPAEFFRGELRVYSDWREAFIRELFQNSLDARPSRIDVSFTDTGSNGQITFTDDGHGMTRQVLEEVFFALGKTTKTGSDSVGGFGRARIIICFAQARYTIRTGNLLVEGYGSEYAITEVGEYVQGCQFTVDLIDSSSHQVQSAFRRVLNECSTLVPIYLNGERQYVATLPQRATKVLKDSNGRPWARVYVNSASYSSQMKVRVQGLVMFTQWLSVSDDVIVELVSERSREVLAASRDRLVGEFHEQLTHFVSDLAQNRKAALRPNADPLDVHVGGGGFMYSGSNLSRVVARTASEDTGELIQLASTSGLQALKAVSDELQARQSLDMAFTPVPAHALGFDVFMFADAHDARVRKLVRAWDPTGWTATTGTRRRALLLAWKQAVEVAIDTLIRVRPGLENVYWTVGWVFDQESKATHGKRGAGHVLNLNPVDANGKPAYKVSERSSRQRLLAIALHEAAHVALEGHDEAYAGLLTEMYAVVDTQLADKAIRS